MESSAQRGVPRLICILRGRRDQFAAGTNGGGETAQPRTAIHRRTAADSNPHDTRQPSQWMETVKS